MRQDHKAGEKLFVDWAGDTLPYVDGESGELRDASLFLAVLAAPTTPTPRPSPISHGELPVRPRARLCVLRRRARARRARQPEDRRGARRPLRGRDLRALRELAAHYGTAVMPARIAKPRDKAKVETGVLVAYRWICAVLRKRTFYSLAEMNLAIAAQLEP